MFGAGNYCENRFEEINTQKEIKTWSKYSSPDAEIAVFDKDGNFQNFPDCPEFDQVLGWVDSHQMLKIMNWVAEQ